MGSLHDAVVQYVEQEVKKDSGVKNATLFAGACEIDDSIGELRPQQFHARYRPRRPRKFGAAPRQASGEPAAHPPGQP